MNVLYEWIRPEWMASFFLIVARMSGLFVVAPLFGNRALPARMKIAFIVTTALILFPMIAKFGNLPRIQTDMQFVSMALIEVSIGLIIGLVALTIFSGIQIGGDFIGTQAGLSMATMFDPANQNSSVVLATFYSICGGIMFLYLDGHHLILAALIKSFEILPLGQGIETALQKNGAHLVSAAFTMGLQMALPLLIVMTMLNVIFGFINKISPSMNVFFNTGLVLTPLLALIVLMASLPLFRFLLQNMVDGLDFELLRSIQIMKGGSGG